MTFSILVSMKLLHIHKFLRFLPCGSCETIKHSLNTFFNVLWFPNTDYFQSIFFIFVWNKLKKLKIYLFGSVDLFLYIGKELKTTQKYLFRNVILFHKNWLVFIRFFFLVFLRKTLKKKHVFSNFILDFHIEWIPQYL